MTKNCIVCGKAFTPKRGDARTCSDTCRKRKNRAQSDNYLYARKEYLAREIETLAKMLNHPDGATAMECRYYLIDLRNLIDEQLSN